MNVLPIERRDERLIQLGEDVVSHFIADAFDAAEFGDLEVDLFVIGKELNHGASAIYQIARHLREHLKKGVVPGNKRGHQDLGAPNWNAVERGTISCGWEGRQTTL